MNLFLSHQLRTADKNQDGGAALRVGFIPLIDCAALVVAAEKGFAAAEGIRLELVRETSWANIRDRVSFDHFEAAQMLAPMPIATTLGVGSITVPMIAPMALGLGGNAITVSNALWRAMDEAGADHAGDAAATGAALARIIERRARTGLRPLVFGMVYPFSCHNYELRYWLAASGIDPDRDMRLIVIPPPFMVDAMTAGHVDGFCVGEPWNSLAAVAGAGVVVTTKAHIWRYGPEKVLGVTRDWAAANPARLAALMRALHVASGWCDDPDHHAELADMLATPHYLDCPAEIVGAALGGRLAFADRDTPPIPDFLIFGGRRGTLPDPDHAAWFYGQMIRWGQTTYCEASLETAKSVYRPDLCHAALGGSNMIAPSHGALSFFDGRSFDARGPKRTEE